MKVKKKPSPAKSSKEVAYEFQNPHGSLIRCTVKQGKGTIKLYKDNEKVGEYDLSTEPGVSSFIQLNTDREHKMWKISVKGTGSGKNSFLLELPDGTKEI
jgi:hypothetical protein